MANRDEAKAFKDRKPIDYQMFLTNKWTSHSLLDHHENLEKKSTLNSKENDEQNFRENRVRFVFLINDIFLVEILQTYFIYDGNS